MLIPFVDLSTYLILHVLVPLYSLALCVIISSICSDPNDDGKVHNFELPVVNGDQLIMDTHRMHAEFKYPQGIHNVLEVNKADYHSCTNSTPIATHTSGDDKITIKSHGHRFFICGVPGHCAAGQKLDVRVLKTQRARSSDAPSPAPAASASAPALAPAAASPRADVDTSTPPAASATPTDGGTTTTAPAPNANGAGIVSAGNSAFVALAVAVFMAMLQ